MKWQINSKIYLINIEWKSSLLIFCIGKQEEYVIKWQLQHHHYRNKRRANFVYIPSKYYNYIANIILKEVFDVKIKKFPFFLYCY